MNRPLPSPREGGDDDFDASAVPLAPRLARWPVVKGTLKVMVSLFLIYYFVIPTIPLFLGAAEDIRRVDPFLIGFGFALELLALFCYSLLTRAALPEHSISLPRLYRIQLSTRALSGVMPAGSAASSALGYRLLTLSGVATTDAGFALATVGLGSAVMLNIILLLGLLVSIPIRGVNPFYGTAAIVGIVLIGLSGAIVAGLLKGQQRSERIARWVALKLRLDADRAITLVRHVADRIRELFDDPRLLARVALWAALNWLLDAAALLVFLRAFGGHIALDGLIIAFCLANVMAVIPITPGGLGIIEAVMIPTIVAFGPSKSVAALGVAAYRFAQYWFPLVLGAGAYLSLRVGPWSIDRRDRLRSLREEAARATEDDTSGIEWAEAYGRRRRPSDETSDLSWPPAPRSE
ncbi:MAG: lysylphosphatidylglycerol synthase transmembrane domain-containing protein [Ilumatobacteraceae bacterium]